jgi:hypothetical protein
MTTLSHVLERVGWGNSNAAAHSSTAAAHLVRAGGCIVLVPLAVRLRRTRNHRTADALTNTDVLAAECKEGVQSGTARPAQLTRALQ